MENTFSCSNVFYCLSCSSCSKFWPNDWFSLRVCMWSGVFWRLPRTHKEVSELEVDYLVSGHTTCPGLLLYCCNKTGSKSIWDREEFLWLISPDHGTSQRRARTGTWKQERKQSPWRRPACQPVHHGLLSLLSCIPQTTCSEVAPLTVGWALPCQSLIKKLPHTIAHRDNSSSQCCSKLCPVDKIYPSSFTNLMDRHFLHFLFFFHFIFRCMSWTCFSCVRHVENVFFLWTMWCLLPGCRIYRKRTAICTPLISPVFS